MKVFLIDRRWVSALIALAACGAIFCAVSFPGVVTAASSTRQLPIYSVEREQRAASVTINISRADIDVRPLMDALARGSVEATFFVTGEWAQANPEDLLALTQAGHEVMSHGQTYTHYKDLDADQIMEDVTACGDAIEAVTGQRPALVRCPYGEFDDHVIAAIRALDLEAIQWDVDSQDWKGASAEDIRRRVLEKIEPGSILLFHGDGTHTAEALPALLESLLGEGWRLTPVSQLLLQGEYVVDDAGRQRAAPVGENE